jgi:ribosomal protein L11 methyltransferase
MLELAGPERAAGAAPFPLILANLLSHTHLALLPRYASLTTPGGHLILGGILGDEAGSVTEAARGHGFQCAARRVIDGWASLLFVSTS